MHWTKIAIGPEKTAKENLKGITDGLVLIQGNPFIFPEKLKFSHLNINISRSYRSWRGSSPGRSSADLSTTVCRSKLTEGSNSAGTAG